jgi:hypothetical protein
MNLRRLALESVNVIRIYRDGHEQRESMPRWLAELMIGAIAHEESDVARARIEAIHIDGSALYSTHPVDLLKAHQLALQMAAYMPDRYAA